MSFDLSNEAGRVYLATVLDTSKTDMDRAGAAMRLGMFQGLAEEILALARDPDLTPFVAEYVGGSAVRILHRRGPVTEDDLATFSPSAREGVRKLDAAVAELQVRAEEIRKELGEEN